MFSTERRRQKNLSSSKILLFWQVILLPRCPTSEQCPTFTFGFNLKQAYSSPFMHAGCCFLQPGWSFGYPQRPSSARLETVRFGVRAHCSLSFTGETESRFERKQNKNLKTNISLIMLGALIIKILIIIIINFTIIIIIIVRYSPFLTRFSSCDTDVLQRKNAKRNKTENHFSLLFFSLPEIFLRGQRSWKFRCAKITFSFTRKMVLKTNAWLFTHTGSMLMERMAGACSCLDYSRVAGCKAVRFGPFYRCQPCGRMRSRTLLRAHCECFRTAGGAV